MILFKIKRTVRPFLSNIKISKTIFYRLSSNARNELVVGTSDFKKLVEQSKHFVDKSGLIEKFINIKAESILVTFPRRWGKSLNIDMLIRFLEIQDQKKEFKKKEDNKDNKILETENYKLFNGDFVSKDLDQLPKPLKIMENTQLVEAFFGKHPVILIDFKAVNGETYDEIQTQLKYQISCSFKRHQPVFESLLRKTLEKHNQNHKEANINLDQDLSELIKAYKNILPTSDISQFCRLFDNNGKDAEKIDIETSLLFLSRILYNFYEKKVFIFMDEYDSPINNILRKRFFKEEDEEKTITLLRSIMANAFKGNIYIEKGLIIGVFRIAKASLFSDLNNLVEFNFLNNPFAKYYGFTEEEVKSLFVRYEKDVNEQISAKDWFNGYLVDGTLLLYNPWSIANFLFYGKIKNFWVDSGNVDDISSLFKLAPMKKMIESLIDGKSIEVNLNDLQISAENYKMLQKLAKIEDSVDIEQPTVNIFFSFIFSAGYLTISKVKTKEQITTSVKIPNQEIRQQFLEKLESYYSKSYSISPELFDKARDNLKRVLTNPNKESTKQLQISLEKLFRAHRPFLSLDIKTLKKSGISGEQVGLIANEKAIHTIISNLAHQMRIDSFMFGSEIYVKKCGIADMILINNDVGIGLILEFKYNRTNNDNESAASALKQAKKYLPFFNDYKKVTIKICMGVEVTPEKKVTIKMHRSGLTTSKKKFELISI
jgi:hypothetical protein